MYTYKHSLYHPNNDYIQVNRRCVTASVQTELIQVYTNENHS